MIVLLGMITLILNNYNLQDEVGKVNIYVYGHKPLLTNKIFSHLLFNRAKELNQEFYFAHTLTRVMINNIFNTSFYGSQIWDLFSQEAVRLEKIWNISQRIIHRIPRVSHRYFIKPLTETRHVRFSLQKRFTNFVKK